MYEQVLAVVGGGQMGRALVGGMFANEVLSPSQTRLVEPNSDSQSWWTDHHPEVEICELAEAIAQADLVLLAVKPNIIPLVAQQPPGFWTDKLVISIAAGVDLERLGGWIGHDRIVRVMPNTPCLVGAGACAYCCGNDVGGDDRFAIQSILESVGEAYPVNESLMDGVTGLSGSGPAYVCMMIEGLADGGVRAGLPRELAMQLATQTVMGTARMIAETEQHPGVLKDAVASPGGTTIAAIAVLEQHRVRAALLEAVVASANRSRELSDG